MHAHMYHYTYAGMNTQTGTTEDNSVPFLQKEAAITNADPKSETEFTPVTG